MYLSVYVEALHLKCVVSAGQGEREEGGGGGGGGGGHQTGHRGTELAEECSGTSLKPLTKEQRCGCVQV